MPGGSRDRVRQPDGNVHIPSLRRAYARPIAQGNLANLPRWALDLLGTARVGHLGLLDGDDRPRVLPVAFALREGRIWSAVDTKPKSVAPADLARVRFLRRRPEVAFTVDHYDDDWSRLAWVQVLGRAEILAVGEAPGALEALARRYEPYRADPPPGPLLRVDPVRCLHWRADRDQASSSRRTR